MRNALTFLTFAVLSLAAVFASDIPSATRSPARLAVLDQIIEEEITQSGDTASAAAIARAALPKLLAADPALAQKEAPQLLREVDSELRAERRLQADALKNFPALTDAELAEKAAERYPLYQSGERIKIVYKSSPRSTKAVTGYFTAVRGGFVVLNGNTHILLNDLAGISGNDGPDGEIAKFDKNYNRTLREEYIQELIRDSESGRKQFLEDEADAYRALQLQDDFLENERNGFVYYNEMWFSADNLVLKYTEMALERRARERSAAERQNAAVGTANIEEQLLMASAAQTITPAGTRPSVAKYLAQQEAEARRLQEEELARLREAEELAAAEAEEAARRAAKKVETPKVEEEGSNTVLFLIIGVVLLVGAGVAWHFLFNREKDLDVSKFFEGKGKLQKDFWDAANANPDSFRYVAYLFDDLDSAKRALAKLSFISLDQDGNVYPTKNDIRIGSYAHQGRAVSFVGGEELNYARWREATMVWPELPNANYFKVSPEPAVKLELPDIDKLRKEGGIEIQELGIEDIKTETGEVNLVYRYRGASKNDALQFLSKFKIQEDGIIARVETPEGTFGKDINGVFID